jgi:hypothetical protein
MSADETSLEGPRPRFVALVALCLAAVWAFDVFVVRTHLLATWKGEPALVPLYAFFSPAWSARWIVFAAAAALFVRFAPRAIDPERCSRVRFLLVLLAVAVALPLALFAGRQDPSELGRQFVYYQNDEFYYDARRIADAPGFLAHYVEAMPELSLHGRHFPPGNALLLYLVGRVFGPGTLPAGIACLACFALAMVLVYFAIEEICRASARSTPRANEIGFPEASDRSAPNDRSAQDDISTQDDISAQDDISTQDDIATQGDKSTPGDRSSSAVLAETSDAWHSIQRRARQGALLLLAAPSMLDFACTSMDAVFFFFAATAWLAGLFAFRAEARVRHAIGAGVALFVATFFSFSAIPLGLAIAIYGAIAGRRDPRATFLRLVWIALAFAACTGLVALLTGFSLVDCFAVARRGARELMDRSAGRPVSELWAELSFGNVLAFLLGAGIALVAAAAMSLCESATNRGRAKLGAWDAAALTTLLVMSCGGIYFLETERIWLFALPWLAAIAVSRRALASGAMTFLVAVGLVQTLAMEALLYTLW